MPRVEEEAKLKTDEYQQKLVDGISLGIDRYFNGDFENKGALD